MNRLLLALTVVFAVAFSAKADSQLIQQADSAYTSDDFSVAAALYRQAIADEGESAKLWFNLGNAYYRMGETGEAILSYERALRIDPTDQDVRYNLDFVNTRITDRPGERGTFVGNLLDSLACSMLPNLWAWSALVLFALTALCLLLYLFMDNVTVRKTGFFGGLVTFVATLISLFFAVRSTSIATADNIAIVTAPSTILSTVPRSPNDRTQEAMLLHEGTKVTILDSLASRSAADSIAVVWYDVEVDNAHRAWINAADVTKVIP